MADANSQSVDAFLGGKRVPRWRRWLKWVVLAAILVAALFFLSRCFGGSAATQYVTVPVKQQSLQVTVSATGKLAPTNQVQVGSELSGLVEKVLVDVNDRVTAGQLLAVLDTSRLQDAITQSQAALNANLAAVAQAQATLQEARAQLGRLEEVRRLSGGRVPSETELATQRANVARAQAALKTAQANVVSARAALSSNQTQLSKAAIRSPVNGVVLARQIDAGQTVAASFNTPTLFVIAEDLSAMELQVAIDEADVGEVKEGQPATFTVDAFPGRTFPATIQRVDVGSNLSATASSSSASTTSTASQVVSYGAILTVANPELVLRPGMTATAEIVTTERNNVLAVPNAALRFTPTETAAASGGNSGGIAGSIVPRRRGGGGSERTATIGRGAQQTVYVLGQDGKPQPVQVTTGVSNGSLTEVTGGGLKPGMQVITGQLSSEGAQRRAAGQAPASGNGGQRQSGGQRGQ